jgi:hypothetical protein
MSGNDSRLLRRQLAFHYMKVGPADAAGADSNQNFTFPGLGNGNFAQLERGALDRTRVLEHAGSHGC